ncbi:MAG TPA: NADH-quinone oxidoreductase subunit K [Candidatus Dormibacteraeota bacterium]|nr:NADH-quinone oxidoreductase subunit K [Candidatus Dormibacteraeota bacterium]
MSNFTPGLVAVLFVAAGLLSIGALGVAWRRNLAAALAAVPLMFGGAGIAFVGVARFAARAPAQVQPAYGPRVIVGVSGPPVGQEIAVLIAVVSLGVVALGVALAARASRSSAQERPR